MSKIINLLGKHFGKLTVFEFAYSKNGCAYWKCKCDCGNIKNVRGADLRRGTIVSCGCHRKEKWTHKTHGLESSRLYTIWEGMKQRCFNSNSERFKDYGARGITVCEEWKNSFKAFYDWAVENGYSDELTIDRIDVNGNYCPDNCRWITRKGQANNRRSNHIIEFKGEQHNIKQWSEITGINENTLRTRISRNYSLDKIFKEVTSKEQMLEKLNQ